MHIDWKRHVQPPKKNSHKIDIKDSDPDTLYFYTDGHFYSNNDPNPVRRVTNGSWSVLGFQWNAQGKEWEEIVTAKARQVSANSNIHMEIRAITIALQIALQDYPDRNICIRTDLEKNARDISDYLDSYKENFPGTEADAIRIRNEKRKYDKKFPDNKELYDVLDIIGTRGWGNGKRLNVKYVERTFDDGIKLADKAAEDVRFAL